MQTFDKAVSISFQDEVKQGIPAELPAPKAIDPHASHAPIRNISGLSRKEKVLAVRNALRYFPKEWHAELSVEFAEELNNYGRIYMYRFMPEHAIHARPIFDYPAKSRQAASIMLMIQNNLDYKVAKHPQEL